MTRAALDRDLVCVDLETTGGNANWHRIIEIGTVEVDRNGAAREWSTLVNPGCRIPPTIEAFTGISDTMVAEAPAFEDVHRELLARLDGRLFVAHNARFDYGFVRAELARLELRWTTRPLCTVRLSRRLFPDERSHNLDALIARHGLACAARHRALGDARVLRELLERWHAQLGAEPLAAAVEAVLYEAPLPAALPPDLADELPDAAGVYRLYGEGGALLYVGKARNIRGRVLEHFAAVPHSTAAARLAERVRRVTWTETAGELGALLEEARTVKREQPLLNRRLRSHGPAFTIRLSPAVGAGAEIAEVDALDPVRSEFYGLYRDHDSARRALSEIARAHGLCQKMLGLERGAGAAGEGGSCFAFQLGRCRGACVGREPAALHDIRLRLALATQRLKPWPFRGRILVGERDWRGDQDWHVLAGWRYLGTVHEREAAEGIDPDATSFDPDIYRILKRFLATAHGGDIVELD